LRGFEAVLLPAVVTPASCPDMYRGGVAKKPHSLVFENKAPSVEKSLNAPIDKPFPKTRQFIPDASDFAIQISTSAFQSVVPK
jgi:hypothetical protein